MRPDLLSPNFQAVFHREWAHLTDPHVRALAWLLIAPDLLDPAAPQWENKIASLSGTIGQETKDWLAEIDREPLPLHAYLALQPFARLGRYAEKLMAFYFEHAHLLFAYGVQVRAEKNDTIGEFDFLLTHGDQLVHWEFATKFYLLESTGAGQEADYFVGPNLADTLGAKMRKILDRQLALSLHPAAQIHLPKPVASAQALVKGWLFYHDDDPAPSQSLGVLEGHCRGFWCTQRELTAMDAEAYAILPRLSWLAPARIDSAACKNLEELQNSLDMHFAKDSMPVMVALMIRQGDIAIEKARGFVVPDDWRQRAADRRRSIGFFNSALQE